MSRKIDIVGSIDWLTIGLYALLVIAGWINIYAAVYNEEHQSIFDLSQRYGKQMIWIFMAILIALVIFAIDEKFYSIFAYILYGLTIAMLLAVLVVGREINGARSWFGIGEFQIQPAEFAKIATALALAKFMSVYNFKLLRTRNLLMIGSLILLPPVLILLQPDTGSALVFFIFILVLYREGLPGEILLAGFLFAFIFLIALMYSQLNVLILLCIITLVLYFFLSRNVQYTIVALATVMLSITFAWLVTRLAGMKIPVHQTFLAGIGLASAIALALGIKHKIRSAYTAIGFMVLALAFTYSVDYIFDKVLEPHQQERISILLGKADDPQGIGYNVNQSKIAIGSGGFAGKGFLQGTQTKFNFVPEQSTDFIFCTVGEEWGFLGSTFILCVFGLLLARIIFIAERQRLAFNRIYGYSVVSILFFHVAINVGMTIGVLPVVGIPLPFFSYGGSSLWAFTALLFVLLKLDSNRKRYMR